VLRRAQLDVVTAALQTKRVTGSHGIEMAADTELGAVNPAEFEAVVLPGGMPGSVHLRDDARVRRIVQELHRSDRLVAAICAAPMVLEAAGVLAGRRATSFPGEQLPSARYCEQRVVVDGNLVTSRGAGTAMEFALALVRHLTNAEVADGLAERMLANPSGVHT
ncbi:DJ-1 family glyoxalase III, partial [Myxococcota bacterium]